MPDPNTRPAGPDSPAVRCSCTEDTVIDKALGGSQDAFTRLYDQNRSRVFATVVRVARNQEEAEDLVQMTFMKAFGALRSFRRQSAFSTWLTRIAMNVSTTHLRSRRALQNCLDSVTAIPEDSPALPSSRSDPESDLFRRERRDALESSISTLPANHRRALVLHYVKERSYQEITQELRVPVGTLKVWLHRARARLRTELEKHDPDTYVN